MICPLEKEQKDLDFTADIIVETNFKVYAYSVSDFILKLLGFFNYAKHFLLIFILNVQKNIFVSLNIDYQI